MVAILATSFAVAAIAQVGTAVKETGAGAVESSKEAGDKLKAGVSSEPNKSVDKAKAQVHKAKAHVHRHRAKKAVDTAKK
jgi:hypothetical protein